MTARLGLAGRLAAASIPSKLTPLLILGSIALGAFAIEDIGPDHSLSGHMTVFWVGLLVTLLLVILGAAINIPRGRRRKQQG